MISAGAVAKDGIARKIGDKKREIPNRIAVVRDVKPVRPPGKYREITGEELSKLEKLAGRKPGGVYHG